MIRVNTDGLQDLGEDIRRSGRRLAELEDRLGEIRRSLNLCGSVFDDCLYALSGLKERVGDLTTVSDEMASALFRIAETYNMTERQCQRGSGNARTNFFADVNPYRRQTGRLSDMKSPEIHWIPQDEIRAAFSRTIRMLMTAEE